MPSHVSVVDPLREYQNGHQDSVKVVIKTVRESTEQESCEYDQKHSKYESYLIREPRKRCGTYVPLEYLLLLCKLLLQLLFLLLII